MDYNKSNELIHIEPMIEEVKNSPDLSEEEIQHLGEQVDNFVNGEFDVFREDNVTNALQSLKKYAIASHKMRYPVLNGQSKEINDIYTKVDDILKHDRFAKFKHRNDLISGETRSIIIHSKEDDKLYYFSPDELYWNTQFFENLFSDLLRQYQTDTVKKELMQAEADKQIYELRQIINKNHPLINEKFFEIILRIQKYNNVKLKSLLVVTRDSIDTYYGNIYIMNNLITKEISNLQLIEKQYADICARFAKVKDAKKYLIEPIFMELIKWAKVSIDYNNKYVDLAVETFKFYYEQIKAIYDIIRQ